MPINPSKPAVTERQRTASSSRAPGLGSAALQGVLLCFLFCTGALPVLAIPLSLAGLITLHMAADDVIIPLWGAALTLLLLCWRTPVSRAARAGLLGGLVAVTAYDMLRLPFILVGGWRDFIPRLGEWITGSNRPNAVIGYLWRYVGDGGGIGMAFALFCLVLGIRRRLVLFGLSYGVFVWSGLIGTLLFVPHAQALLFRLTPATVVVSLAGHLVYGSVLGWTIKWSDRGYRVLEGLPLKPTTTHGSAIRSGQHRRSSRPGQPDPPAPHDRHAGHTAPGSTRLPGRCLSGRVSRPAGGRPGCPGP